MTMLEPGEKLYAKLTVPSARPWNALTPTEKNGWSRAGAVAFLAEKYGGDATDKDVLKALHQRITELEKTLDEYQSRPQQRPPQLWPLFAGALFGGVFGILLGLVIWP